MTRPKIRKDRYTSFRPWHASCPDNPNLWRLCKTWQEAMQFVGGGQDCEPAPACPSLPWLNASEGEHG